MCALWVFSHLWRRWAWWRPAHTAETLCGSRWTSVDNGWAPQTQYGEALTGHQRRPSTPTPATWWPWDSQKVRSTRANLHLPAYTSIYTSICRYFMSFAYYWDAVGKACDTKGSEVSAIKGNSFQSPHINKGAETLCRPTRSRVESDFEMKMTLVITGGLRLYDPCNLHPT